MSNCIDVIGNQGSQLWGKIESFMPSSSVILDLKGKYQHEFTIYIIPTSLHLESKSNDKSQ